VSKIKVIIVDDSALMRRLFSEIVNSDPAIELIATAVDPLFAMEKIKDNWPDVIITDLMMPRMDGLAFINKIMQSRPTPIIAISAFAKEGETLAIEALARGALFFIEKPTSRIDSDVSAYRAEIIDSIKQAKISTATNLQPSLQVEAVVSTNQNKAAKDIVLPDGIDFIGLGTSTGGTQAIEKLLSQIKPPMPPMAIVIHMPDKFLRAFVTRLIDSTELTVKVAESQEIPQKNHVYFSQGNIHLKVKSSENGYQFTYDNSEKVNGHKPSVDVLMDSMAIEAGSSSLGILMTGMGKDGAKGLLAIKNAGGTTIIQDEASSVVYGMPKAAKLLNANNFEMNINDIAFILNNKINLN